MYNEKLDCETMDLTDELREQGNFVRLPHNLLRLNKISMQARLVWAAFYSYGWNNGPIFPGMDTVADDMGCSKKSLLKYRKELEGVGLLKVQRRGLNKPNKYTLCLPQAKIEIPETNTLTDQESTNVETNTLTDQETNTITHLNANTSSHEVEKTKKTKINKKSVCTHSSIMAKINKTKPTQDEINKADEVITHIENIAEKESVKLNFDRTTKSRNDIIEGLKKYSIDELKLVAEMKCKEWIGDTKTMGWVNPNTLFRDGKINNNVVAARAWSAKGKPLVNGCGGGYRGVQSDDDYSEIVK